MTNTYRHHQMSPTGGAGLPPAQAGKRMFRALYTHYSNFFPPLPEQGCVGGLQLPLRDLEEAGPEPRPCLKF